MNLKEELAQAIKNHDHYYQYSDDHRVYSSGMAQRNGIMELLKVVFDKKSEQLKFWNEHAPEGCGYTKTYIQELIDNGN